MTSAQVDPTTASDDGPSGTGDIHAETAARPVLVVDLGGQYAQLIARRVRELGRFSEVVRHDTTADELRGHDPVAIILSGGPASVYEEGAPQVDAALFELGVPTLGICYGMQLMASALGGEVARTGVAEFGRTQLTVPSGAGSDGAAEALLFGRLDAPVTECWMSHRDSVARAPEGAVVTATTPGAPIAAFEDRGRGFFAVQFHPEVVHSPGGTQMLEAFLTDAASAPNDWSPAAVVEEQTARIRAQVGDRRVICALSGGVDSSVAAMLVHRAVGDQLTCVFVDHGLLRQGEAEGVVEMFEGKFHVPLVHVDAREQFLGRLAGVSDPETKRKIIGDEFIRTFEREAARIAGDGNGPVDYLVQGTLYSDVIESGGGHGGTAATIKSHHNVGGLPDDLSFELCEPLRMLFKDEVRRVGEELGLPRDMVWRQPFPGPGLAIRIIGDITEERLEALRAADAIFLEEVKAARLYTELWQSFCVLPAIRSVGVQGDGRTYAYPIVLRAVTSDDAMTADWARLPYDLLEKVSNRIVGEVADINRVVLDITSKPPGTIEWE